MRIAIATMGGLLACAGPASAAEFGIAFIENRVAHVVDFAKTTPGADGIAPLVLYSARATPAPDGRAVYGEMRYAFRCATRSVRADGFYVYDAQFRSVFKQPGTSPWRPLPAANHMPELYGFACGGVRPGAIKPLKGPTWMAALQQARATIP